MTEDERIVREAVIDPVLEKNAGNGWIHYWVRYGKVSIFNPNGSGFDSASEAWSAARAFTDDHREQIRQKEEEIALVYPMCLSESEWFDWRNRCGSECDLEYVRRTAKEHVQWSRILALLQANLAELKRGWKTGE